MNGDAQAGDAKILDAAEEEDDREKLDKRIDAVNASSSTARNSWVFFLGLMAYLGVVTAGVTHKDLLLDNQIKLTALGELSLSRFFAFAPFAFLIIYIGLLLQLASLADKARALNAEISALPEDSVGNRRHQHPLRDNISTFMITQALAGRRVSVDRMFLMQATSWVTLAALPVLLLLFFQVTYLPYHDQEATFGHQLFVVAGAIFATRYVPEIMQVGARTNAKASRIDRALRVSFAATFVGVGLFSFFIATVPDSALDRATRWFWPTQVPMGWSRYTRPVFPLTALFFEGDSNSVTGTPSSLLSRNLVVIDSFKKDGDKSSTRLSLRGRDLRYAIFDRSDFTGADFIGAHLDGARFDGAVLKDTKFGCGSLNPSGLSSFATKTIARIRDLVRPLQRRESDLFAVESSPSAKTSCSVLSFGSYSEASLEGAVFKQDLANVSEIDHVEFHGAYLPRIDLSQTNLTGTSFAGARLGGSNFSKSILISTSFYYANVQDVHFDASYIILSDFRFGSFDLSSFRLASIILVDAERGSFVGTKFGDAVFYGSRFAKSSLWGAEAPDVTSFVLADLAEARLDPSEVSGEEETRRKASGLLDNEVEARRAEISKATNLEIWKKSENLAVFLTAKRTLSDSGYKFFESASDLAKSLVCNRDITIMEELVAAFEISMRDIYGGGIDYGTLHSFADVATQIPQFSGEEERLKKARQALGEFTPNPATGWYETGYYGIPDVGLELGEPGPFLEKLASSGCKTAEKVPERWASLIHRLQLMDRKYKQRQKQEAHQEK